MAAGVGDARDGAGPGVVGEVVDRERVEVGAQRDERPARWRRCRRPARCVGSRRDRQPASLEPVGDDVGGALLGPGELGVGVQVAAQVDELVGVLVDDRASIRASRGVAVGVAQDSRARLRPRSAVRQLAS